VGHRTYAYMCISRSPGPRPFFLNKRKVSLYRGEVEINREEDGERDATCTWVV
jgi:hypothetical protein